MMLPNYYMYTLLNLPLLVFCEIGSLPPRHAQGWYSLAPIPLHPRQEHATVALSSTKLAILGGIIPSPDDQPGVVTTDIVQVYHVPSGSWTKAAPLPIPLNHPNAAVVDGKLFVLGGLTPDAEGSWQATPRCWVYDTPSDTWTELPPMVPPSDARGSATIGVHGESIILAGGMEVLVPGPGNEQRTVSTVTSFDTETGTWGSLPGLPEERDHAAGAVINGVMYVIGGRRFGQHNITDTVFSLRLTPDTGDSSRGSSSGGGGWRSLPARMPTPRGGLVAGTVSSSTKTSEGGSNDSDGMKQVVYTFGGEGNPEEGMGGVFDDVEAFDPGAEGGGEWWSEGPMLVKKHGTAAVAIGGGVYIPGGGIEEGGAAPVSDFEVYFPS